LSERTSVGRANGCAERAWSEPGGGGVWCTGPVMTAARVLGETASFESRWLMKHGTHRGCVSATDALARSEWSLPIYLPPPGSRLAINPQACVQKRPVSMLSSFSGRATRANLSQSSPPHRRLTCSGVSFRLFVVLHSILHTPATHPSIHPSIYI
jgi:hypothetical protein